MPNIFLLVSLFAQSQFLSVPPNLVCLDSCIIVAIHMHFPTNDCNSCTPTSAWCTPHSSSLVLTSTVNWRPASTVIHFTNKHKQRKQAYLRSTYRDVWEPSPTAGCWPKQAPTQKQVSHQELKYETLTYSWTHTCRMQSFVHVHNNATILIKLER